MQNNYYVYIYRDPLDDTPFYIGKGCKESTKKKISQSNLGRVFSEEHKIKLSLAAKNRPKRVMSKDTKNKISASNKGKIRTNEYLERISSIRKGKNGIVIQ
jgi:hypothetical protein